MRNNSKLINAARRGDAEQVKKLLAAGEPKAYRCTALRQAASEGHAEVVKLLLPVSDSKTCRSAALRWAAYNGHVDVVKLLLPVLEKKQIRNSTALCWAIKSGNTKVVQLLEEAVCGERPRRVMNEKELRMLIEAIHCCEIAVDDIGHGCEKIAVERIKIAICRLKSLRAKVSKNLILKK